MFPAVLATAWWLWNPEAKMQTREEPEIRLSGVTRQASSPTRIDVLGAVIEGVVRRVVGGVDASVGFTLKETTGHTMMQTGFRHFNFFHTLSYV